MSDKEKMKKAFQNLKAPEDTLERVMETMRRKELRENMRSGQSVRVGQSVRTKRLTLALVAVLVLALGCGSVYAGVFELFIPGLAAGCKGRVGRCAAGAGHGCSHRY